MRELQDTFADELVIISVHSAKFTTEKQTENIRQAAKRHHMTNPVVNDADFIMWQHYAVRAWPTVVLIDPAGYVIATQAGEVHADELIPVIENLITDFAAKEMLNQERIDFGVTPETTDDTMLRYPAKLLAVPLENKLFVADTGNHRILELVLDSAQQTATIVNNIGTGQAGFSDGTYAEACFDSPHGLALWEDTLYVADTENHALRKIDLNTQRVTTIAGNGQKARGLAVPHLPPLEMSMRSPWAVSVVQEGLLLIAMAGSHQIWAMIGDDQLGVFAGSGSEALHDGPRAEAAFNQPSDLVLHMNHLFVADAEASAIRLITLDEDSQVGTLIGQGLFDWGDIDGVGSMVRLQHPTGLCAQSGVLYIADSFNHKIKTLDPRTGEVLTLIGNGDAGHTDGMFSNARLYEPEGVDILDETLYIADTNNHCIRIANLDTGVLHTLDIQA